MPATQQNGWRVGDAGTTIFGPKKPDGALPDVIASKVRREHSRLIAAAPDLLAACRAAQSWIDEYGGIGNTDCPDSGLQGLAEQLQDAIARTRQ